MGRCGTSRPRAFAIGDGLDYEKPACNPVLTQKDLPEGFSKFDFRDPKIWREADGTYSAVTVCLAEDGSGAAVLFQSKDGFDWHFVTVLERCTISTAKCGSARTSSRWMASRS